MSRVLTQIVGPHPYCLRDKKADREANSLATFFGVVGGGIGYAINGFTGLLIGGGICAFIGGIILAAGANKRGAAPPVVRVAGNIGLDTPDNAAQSDNDHAVRLKRLDKLRTDGVITDAEYAERRAVVVSSL